MMGAGRRFVRLTAAVALAAAIIVGSSATIGAAGTGRSSVARPWAVTPSNWTTFDQNNLRTGVDASGNSFSRVTPAWQSPVLDGHLYGQSLVYAGRVFTATENDSVYGMAADNGHVLWKRHLATPVKASNLPCGDIAPTVGITSTPVIDPARSEILVVADEAAPAPKIASHHLIGLNLYTGAIMLNEVIDAPGSKPANQLQRASLALDRNNVIV